MNLNYRTSAQLYELQGGACFYCDCTLRPYPWRNKAPQHLKGYTRDHVLPQVLGGGVELNIVLACFDCNNDKGDRAPTAREVAICKLLHQGVPLAAARALVPEEQHVAIS